MALKRMFKGELIDMTPEQEAVELARISAHNSVEEVLKRELERKIKIGKEILKRFFEYLAIQVASEEKLEYVADNYSSVYILIDNGAIETAKAKILGIAPGGVISQDDLDYLLSLFPEE